MKTVKFYTLGCKVNQYDLQLIREQFISAGFKELEDGCPADIYLINTCTVTHKADSDSLGFIRRARRENPLAFVVVAGCLAESDKEQFNKTEGVDLIIGDKDKKNILKHLPSRFGLDKKDIDAACAVNGISCFYGHTRAFLKIQDGCNNFCSYCKVPYARGRSRSRPLSKIVAEAKRLAGNGFKEIVLCGVCLGAFGRDISPGLNLIDVIEKLEEIDGLLRIRLSSLEPNDVSGGLIKKIRSSSKLCPHLHIPLQSGSDEILKKMNRNYSRGGYLALVEKIRHAVPGIAVTTDILVGFPTETEENFCDTVNLVKEIVPLRTHIFSYSNRPGTFAAKNFKNVTPNAVVKQRAAYLKDVARECSLSFRRRFLNKEVSVLFESRLKEKPRFWQGHSDNYIEVLMDSPDDLKNILLKTRLTAVTASGMCT